MDRRPRPDSALAPLVEGVLMGVSLRQMLAPIDGLGFPAFLSRSLREAAPGNWDRIKRMLRHADSLASFERLAKKHLPFVDGSFVLLAQLPSGEIVMAVDKFGGMRVYYVSGSRLEKDQPHKREHLASLSFSILELSRISHHGHLDALGLSEQFYNRQSTNGRTLVQGIRHIPAGHWICLGAGKMGHPSPLRYWCPYEHYKIPQAMVSTDSVADLVDQTHRRLSAFMEGIRAGRKSVAVPLSGGVDSALLLALAKTQFPEVIAVTPDWAVGANPELSRAKAFAAHLRVPHIVVRLSDADISAHFEGSLASHEAILRNFSSIPMRAVLLRCREFSDVVVYGEGADTLFGSADAFGFARRILRARRAGLFPLRGRRFAGRIISQVNLPVARRLATLLMTGQHEILAGNHRIMTRLPLESTGIKPPGISEVFLDYTRNARTFRELLNVGRARALEASVSDHMFDIERLALTAKVSVVTPFLGSDLLWFSRTLGVRQQFQKGVYKPILKELAARWYPAPWVHAPKLGFATPKRLWSELLRDRLLSECSHSWDDALRLTKVVPQQVEGDPELLWNSVCLARLTERLGFKQDLRLP